MGSSEWIEQRQLSVLLNDPEMLLFRMQMGSGRNEGKRAVQHTYTHQD